MTAAELAEAIEVNVRTVYRDMAALQAMRVPVDGAAGIGYVMRRGFDLPPLMFRLKKSKPLSLVCRLSRGQEMSVCFGPRKLLRLKSPMSFPRPWQAVSMPTG